MATDKQRPLVTIVALVAVALVLLVVLALIFWPAEEPEPEPQAPEPTQLPEPEPQPEPQRPAEPAPEPEPEPEPLPPLDESDDALVRELQERVQGTAPLDLLSESEMLRKWVRAINAAEDGDLVHEYRPLISPAPPLKVAKVGTARTEAEQEYRLLPENYERYEPYVELLTRMEPEQMARLYQRYRPLLEQAFSEQGTDKESFHQVLLDTIDQLLAAPEPPQDIRLERPKVFYEFRDPKLESLPAPQKLMVRIGPENSQTVKRVLRELRQELQSLPEPDSGS